MAWMATQDRDEALDIVQDAMYKLVRSYGKLPEEHWRLLFFKILGNRILDWHRQRKRRSLFAAFSFRSLDDEDEDDFIESLPATPQEQPDSQLERQQISAALETALARLPLRQQQVVMLRLWEGFDVAEAAEIMGCSQGSVKTHLHRATQSLKESLGESIHE